MTETMRFDGFIADGGDVERSIEFYNGNVGLAVEWNAAPAFAMSRVPGAGGGMIGLLALEEAHREGVEETSVARKRALHVEFSIDDLDGLYEELKAWGVVFHQPPHDEPWGPLHDRLRAGRLLRGVRAWTPREE